MTYDQVHALLDYDPTTGVFRWRVRVNRSSANAGDIAGCVDADGYRIITIKGRSYKAHRLAWLYVHGEWPSGHLDHKDNYPGNDWIDNLRPATRSQNGANKGPPSNNTSGYKGVSWNTRSQKWVAKIFVRGRLHYLGLFTTAEEGHVAYSRAAAKHFGEYART